MNNIPFTVCMAVYKNDSASFFEEALMSVYHQTMPPSEIILVIDGPISGDLLLSVENMKSQIDILKVIPLECNMGHAVARQTGIEAASHDLCAIMDADDIAVLDRFEKQLRIFATDKEVAVVGGLIDEFIGDKQNIVGSRFVPEQDVEIKGYMKARCPMNLMTVMLRKSMIQQVGGFMDWYCEEDYYLWLRLALAKYKFYNIQETLVNVRVGEDMYQRRGGKRYFLSEAKLQRYMLKNNIISLPRFIYNVALRFMVQVAMPNGLRGWVFRKFARK